MKDLLGAPFQILSTRLPGILRPSTGGHDLCFKVMVCVTGADLTQQIGQMSTSRFVSKVRTPPMGLEDEIVVEAISPR